MSACAGAAGSSSSSAPRTLEESIAFWHQLESKYTPPEFISKILHVPEERLLDQWLALATRERCDILKEVWHRQISAVHVAGSLHLNRLLAEIIDVDVEEALSKQDSLANRALHYCAISANRIGATLLRIKGDRDSRNLFGATAQTLHHMLHSASLTPKDSEATFLDPAKTEAVDLDIFTPLPSEVSIEIQAEDGSTALVSVDDFAKRKGVRSFLTSHHLSSTAHLLKLYHFEAIVRDVGIRKIVRERVLRTSFKESYVVRTLPGLGDCLASKRDFAPFEPIALWFGEIAFDIPQIMASREQFDPVYSTSLHMNEEHLSFAPLINDGFPNISQEPLLGVSGSPVDLAFFSDKPIATGTLLAWDYGIVHKVKRGPHIEPDFEAILTFLNQQCARGLQLDSKEPLSTAVAEGNALQKMARARGDFETYISAALANQRFIYLMTTPTTHLLILLSSDFPRRLFVQAMNKVSYLYSELVTLPRAERFTPIENFYSLIPALCEVLNTAEARKLCEPGHFFEEARVLTERRELHEINEWIAAKTQALVRLLVENPSIAP
jgi:hypothetical protein